MPDYNGLLNAIKQAAKEQNASESPATVCIGKVLSISPLSVQIDQRFTLPAENLIVPQHLTSYSVSVSLSGSTGTADGHSHSLGAAVMTISNALKVGDKLVLIRQNGGQKYLIIDRVV